MAARERKAKFPFKDTETVTWEKDAQGFIYANATGGGSGGCDGCCSILTNGDPDDTQIVFFDTEVVYVITC